MLTAIALQAGHHSALNSATGFKPKSCAFRASTSSKPVSSPRPGKISTITKDGPGVAVGGAEVGVSVEGRGNAVAGKGVLVAGKAVSEGIGAVGEGSFTSCPVAVAVGKAIGVFKGVTRLQAVVTNTARRTTTLPRQTPSKGSETDTVQSPFAKSINAHDSKSISVIYQEGLSPQQICHPRVCSSPWACRPCK